jgi:hypothetical protein
MTFHSLKWLAVLCLCAPAFAFQLSLEQREPVVYDGIVYTQHSDSHWYASEINGTVTERVFLERLLVKFAADDNPWNLPLCNQESVHLSEQLATAQGTYIGFGWSLLVFPSEEAGLAAAAYLENQRSQDQPIIQFDISVTRHGFTPNDDIFSSQSNLENTTNNCGSFRGDPGPIDYDEDWYEPATLQMVDTWRWLSENTTVPDPDQVPIIAVIDDSFFLDHEDLQGGIWSNIREIPNNGIDDDGNSWIDDVNGFNFAACDGNVNRATDSHGIRVLGIIAAETHNGIGIAGIVHNTDGERYAKVMPLMTGIEHGAGQDAVLSNYYQAMWYAYRNGADIVNASWGWQNDFPMPQTIQDWIDRTSNMVIVAAVGNRGTTFNDIDYPARFNNTLAVTSSECSGVIVDEIN